GAAAPRAEVHEGIRAAAHRAQVHTLREAEAHADAQAGRLANGGVATRGRGRAVAVLGTKYRDLAGGKACAEDPLVVAREADPAQHRRRRRTGDRGLDPDPGLLVLGDEVVRERAAARVHHRDAARTREAHDVAVRGHRVRVADLVWDADQQAVLR